MCYSGVIIVPTIHMLSVKPHVRMYIYYVLRSLDCSCYKARLQKLTKVCARVCVCVCVRAHAQALLHM